MVPSLQNDTHHAPPDAEALAWLRLLLTPGVGRTTARKLLAKAGSAEAIWRLPLLAWAECATQAQVKALAELPADWEKHCNTLSQWLAAPAAGTLHTFIHLGNSQYPQCLLETEDTPLMLFVQGPAALLASSDPWFPYPATLAMVGSRNPSAQGVINARDMAQALAEQGLCIVSGLARGIDAAAHEGALKGKTAKTPCTIAVVGTGLDQVYPRAHTALAQQIALHGLVISEYPLGSEPLPKHFPQRNRIISGLSQGTLVVEAALQSGSLITARLASEQGRDVFAIPGSIHAPQAKGCHALLRQGAKLVETAADILDELQGINPLQVHIAKGPEAIKNEVSKQEPELLRALGHDPMTLDTLMARTGWDAAHLQAQLMELELDAMVARLPGGLYQRITHS
ncbi:DNA-processing protein DprA [Comamonas sp. Y33R10-2]|uniref:DNA-processing protein DprA n=1 Tax=Comamonas sp. Y33R10-2 TaxID=2853257 RepID=UPI001C5CC1EC|nr:DNA-processing protein DprA [Comamonas sp. Y33R10-2]QXZ08670.1 DNA-processing protein DprA [Comamonas sp. Y33R10-2]